MSTSETITDEAIFTDVSTIIGNALKVAHQANPARTHITEACYGIALKQLLSLERPTTKAKAYSEWSQPPQVVLEDQETRNYYNKYLSVIDNKIHINISKLYINYTVI
jgi:hypothetical protein